VLVGVSAAGLSEVRSIIFCTQVNGIPTIQDNHPAGEGHLEKPLCCEVEVLCIQVDRSPGIAKRRLSGGTATPDRQRDLFR
jgi:hypothetical protein